MSKLFCIPSEKGLLNTNKQTNTIYIFIVLLKANVRSSGQAIMSKLFCLPSEKGLL